MPESLLHGKNGKDFRAAVATLTHHNINLIMDSLMESRVITDDERNKLLKNQMVLSQALYAMSTGDHLTGIQILDEFLGKDGK